MIVGIEGNTGSVAEQNFLFRLRRHFFPYFGSGSSSISSPIFATLKCTRTSFNNSNKIYTGTYVSLVVEMSFYSS